MNRVEKDVCGRTLSFEHGRVARQSDGGLLARYGDTVILASAVYAKEPPKEYLDYFPLIVDYRVLAYAAGKIPGGFFKREGKPRDKETLTCRLIDRPIRPLFPANFRADTQIVEYLLSTDLENESEFLGLVAASAALHISDIPFQGPIGACRVGKIGGEFVLNPPMNKEPEAEMWMLYVGIGDQVMTIAGQAREVSPEDIDKGWELAQPVIKQTIDLQEELRKLVGKPKLVNDKPNVPAELAAEIRKVAADRVKAANDIVDKLSRGNTRSTLQRAVISELAEKFPDSDKMIKEVLDEMFGEDMRKRVLETGVRLDGRKETEVREIDCAVGVLPRAHGSALFTRGQTQSLAATTLGTRQDEQVIDDVELEVEERKSYMLHYNFPPFSVGEVKFLRGPGRREIGHGDLAERGLEAVIPKDDDFPYTVRIVSDILESNGSSSMASVCAGSLSLMDAGVPVKAAVAGMAMGLITDGDIAKGAKYRIVTDILGDEDHYGYMDFKVAGTRKGITAIQLDLKLPGVPYSVLAEGIRRATTARLGVLDIMDKTIDKPRADLSKYAPRIVSIVIDKEKIGTVIGPGGKMIRKITEETGATIDIEDDGTVTIASNKVDALNAAKAWVESLVEEVEVGKLYEGRVTRIMNFGAFVEVLPGKEGLVHISQLGPERYNRVEDAVNEGDKVWVKVVEIDDMGRVNLSRRKAMEERGEIPLSDDTGIASRPPRRSGPPHRGRDDRRDRRGHRR
ncbi:polyribonucleotide nucleotidyltransferase [candidate division WOR-3 bacterium]|nr:polyribonucleotide nucleotidyltransferase [candidate division WOR-3 bacterium]